MSTLIGEYYLQVSNQPSDPEAFQNLPIQRHKTSMQNFNINLCVRFTKRCSCGQTHLLAIPSSPISSHYISCKEFFRRSSNFLRSNLSHDLLDPELLDLLEADIISGTQELFHHYSPSPYFDEGDFIVYHLVIEVVIEFPRGIEEQSMQEEIRMVPASTEAIESLRKINFQENIDVKNDNEKNRCCICLEDFCNGEEISTMPYYHHIFHNNCLVQWLKTSHICPLCRYPIPEAHQV